MWVIKYEEEEEKSDFDIFASYFSCFFTEEDLSSVLVFPGMYNPNGHFLYIVEITNFWLCCAD